MAVDYGMAIDCINDLPLRFTMATGKRNLGNALVRRLTSTPGCLEALGEDPRYGYDVRDFVNAGLTASDVKQAQSDIARQCELDERVRAAQCQIALTGPANAQTATIAISIYTDDNDAPFSLVMAVTATTMTISVLEA